MSRETELPILRQIHDLVGEEHHLRATHTGIGLNSAERARLESIEKELDQCWDLLRHRRADEEFPAALRRDERAAEPDLTI